MADNKFREFKDNDGAVTLTKKGSDYDTGKGVDNNAVAKNLKTLEEVNKKSHDSVKWPTEKQKKDSRREDNHENIKSMKKVAKKWASEPSVWPPAAGSKGKSKGFLKHTIKGKQ